MIRPPPFLRRIPGTCESQPAADPSKVIGGATVSRTRSEAYEVIRIGEALAPSAPLG
jgi:hypothetical protein